MKKLLLVLLFVPLVSFSQEQVLNGISLNGPKDFVKSGDYTWTKGNDLIMVQSIGTKLTKEGYISSCKRGSRSSKYVTNITQEISGVDYIFCIQFMEVISINVKFTIVISNSQISFDIRLT